MSSQRLTLENSADFVGKDLGVSKWHVVDQAMIDQFATCTGDSQWIHVDVERANRESPFGGTVAHGYLSLALIAPLSMEIGVIPEGAVAAFNYGVDKVRFLSPVKAGARVRLKVTLMEFAPRDDKQALMKTRNTLEIEGDAKPALIAETLAMVVAARPFR